MGWFKNREQWMTAKLGAVGWYWVDPSDGGAPFIGLFTYVDGKPNINVDKAYEPRLHVTPQTTWRFVGPLKEPKS